MSLKSQEELLAELTASLPSGGRPHKIWAADLRSFLTSLIEEIYARLPSDEHSTDPSLLAPSAPRNIQMDDDLDLFSVDMVPGFPSITEYELSYDNGVQYADLPPDAVLDNGRLYLNIGDINEAAGLLRLRVKADPVTGRPAGLTATNPQAFRVAAPAYIAYRERVAGTGGSIIDNAKTQTALLTASSQGMQLDNFDSWVDSTYGVQVTEGRVTTLYSLAGQDAHAPIAPYRYAPLFENSRDLAVPVVNSTEASKGMLLGTLPALSSQDAYTWGMRYKQTEPSGGILFGNRYGGANSSSQWWRVTGDGQMHHFNTLAGDYGTIAFTLPPMGSYTWLWVVKSGSTATVYNAQHEALVVMHLGSDFDAGCPVFVGGDYANAGLGLIDQVKMKWKTFIRYQGALTASQRGAIMQVS